MSAPLPKSRAPRTRQSRTLANDGRVRLLTKQGMFTSTCDKKILADPFGHKQDVAGVFAALMVPLGLSEESGNERFSRKL